MGWGLDRQLTEEWIVGLAGGYSIGNIDYRNSQDTSQIKSTQFSSYASREGESWQLDTVFTLALFNHETDRFVNVDTVNDHLKADFDGHEISVYGEASYHALHWKGWGISPLAALKLSHLTLDRYTESGGSSALSYQKQRLESCQGSLGIKASTSLCQTEQSYAKVELRGRWLHEFGDTRSHVSAAFASLPSATFDITDADLPRDSLQLGVGYEAQCNKHIQCYLGYDLRFNNEDNAHIATALVRLSW